MKKNILSAGILLVSILFIGSACNPIPNAEPTNQPNDTKTSSTTSSLTANIIIEAPKTGEIITSPVTISGKGIAFEGQINVRVKENTGKLLTQTSIQLTNGMDKYSNFSEKITYEKPTQKNGLIEVYEISAKDGAEINKVSVPVIFGDLQIQDISVAFPKQNEFVDDPMTVQGEANGSWYFEGVFPVELYDANGLLMTSGKAYAQTDWQTNKQVSFKSSLSFDTPVTKEGKLILRNDNPSGLPENSKKIEIPVKFAQYEGKTIVKVYFSNQTLNPNVQDCSLVYPTDHIISPTQAVATAALNELLKGPVASEILYKYGTSINSGVTLQSIKITSGTAYVDFSSQLEQSVGGSCRISSITSQIKHTLTQFPTVTNVVISINGKTEDILQP